LFVLFSNTNHKCGGCNWGGGRVVVVGEEVRSEE